MGAALTCLAFYRAWRGVRTGNKAQAQRAFRARVAAQAFTVAAMVAGGLYYSEDRRRTKEARAAQRARDEEDKKAKWLRELEARDAEEKELQAEVERRKAAAGKKAGRGGTAGAAAGRGGEAKVAADADKAKKELVREVGAEGSRDESKSSWASWFGFGGGKKQPPQDDKKQ